MKIVCTLVAVLMMISLGTITAGQTPKLTKPDQSNQAGFANITVKVGEGISFPGDSLVLSPYEWAIFDNVYHHPGNPSRIVRQLNKRACSFQFPTNDEVGYFSLLSGPMSNKYRDLTYLLFNYLVEKGDSIVVHITLDPQRSIHGDSLQFSFSGKGADKLNCQRQMFLAGYFTTGDGTLQKSDSSYRADNLFVLQAQKQLVVLDQYRQRLSPTVYDLLSLDARAESAYQVANGFRILLRRAKTPTERQLLITQYTSSLPQEFTQGERIKSLSSKYPDLEFIKGVMENLTATNTGSVNYGAIFNTFEHISYKPLRERLQTDFIQKYGRVLKNRDSLVRAALDDITITAYRKTLEPYLHFFSGKQAFNFSLPDIYKKTRTLDEFKGKVVFMDFWFTGCSPCRLLYKEQIKKVKETLKDNGKVVFITVSIDTRYEVWAKSVKDGAYTDLAAVNLYTNGEGIRHPIIQYYGITGYPTCILIDQQGRLAPVNSGRELSTREGILTAIHRLLLPGTGTSGLSR